MKQDLRKLPESFRAMVEAPGLALQFFDGLPVPVEIFAADGTTVYVNQAACDMVGVKDASAIVGKYNLLEDPVCNDQLGHREGIRRVFQGERAELPDFFAPIQDLVKRGVIEEKPFESSVIDLTMFPIWNGDKLAYVVCVFKVRCVYHGRPDVARAREYIERHWREDYDPSAVARAAHVSVRKLYKLFKEHAEMTPGEYYAKCKVGYIKEKLADKGLTIKEAFAACGEDSRGTYAKIFVDLVGMSPRKYRERMP